MSSLNIQLPLASQSWVPTITGFSVAPGITTAQYQRIPGTNLYYVELRLTGGTSNATTKTFTLPFTAKRAMIYPGSSGSNNGAALTTPPRIDTIAGSNVCNVFTNSAAAAWTAANSAQWVFQGIIEGES